jgi:ABC-type antimicrobial peptide transport system permease subunit
VGVVGDTRYSPREVAVPMLCFCLFQLDRPPNWVALRTAANPAAVGSLLRARLHKTDPNLVLAAVQTLKDTADERSQTERLLARLIGFFSIGALFLACVGMYGIVSYSVARRTSEIGIRIALGAEPARVVWEMLRISLRPVIIGAALGVFGAVPAVRFMGNFAFGVSTQDPIIFIGALLTLTVFAMLATAIPSLHASRIDASTVLRQE